MNPFIEHIAKQAQVMRRSEARVAGCVVSHPQQALDCSIGALADEVGVSQPTVARFASAVGCSGFKSYKLQLAQSMATGV